MYRGDTKSNARSKRASLQEHRSPGPQLQISRGSLLRWGQAGAADRLRRIAVEPILEVNGGLSKSSQASLQRPTPPGCITESDGFSCGRRRKGGFPVCPATKGKGHIAIGAEADIWDGRHPSFGQVRFILVSRVLGHVLRCLTTFRARNSLFVHRDTSYNNPSIPFEFTSENLKRAEEIIGCVPPF